MSTEKTKSMRKAIISGMIGNGLEWYDYALYGQVAWLLAKLFFPSGDASVQLLATFGVFAAGFFARPIGAVFFGWLGDTYGRKMAMVVAVLLMAIPTGLIGVLPTYAEIGIWAPILLTIIRVLQGISLGGEFSGSITYIVEHAPPHRRGLAGVASLVSLILGFLLGLLVVRGMIGYYGQAEFESWAWRVPFIIGIGIGLIGFYIRTHCHESPVFEEAKAQGRISKTPVREAFAKHPWEMLQGFGIYITVTMPFYLTTIYFISFSHTHLGVSTEDALNLSIYNMLALLFVKPLAAWASDYVGRKKIMMTAAIIMMICVYPLFSYFTPGVSLWTIGLVQFTFAIILGFYVGPVAAVLVELFPTSVRFSGMAISYNLAAALFGGTAPIVCEWIIRQTGDNASIAWYVMACNIVSIIALWFYKDRFREPLR
jgi:MFS transporter, MHS family, proline/betaine transporter